MLSRVLPSHLQFLYIHCIYSYIRKIHKICGTSADLLVRFFFFFFFDFFLPFEKNRGDQEVLLSPPRSGQLDQIIQALTRSLMTNIVVMVVKGIIS